MKKIYLLIGAFVSLVACTNNQKSVDPLDAKVDSVLATMSLEEKIGQLDQIDGGLLSDPRFEELVKKGLVGSIINVDPSRVNEVQKMAMESPNGIPLLFARDVIHGYKTIFPIPLGQASTWNPEISKEGARVAAKEASAAGIRYTFAPMIDVTRDPRWGRIAESCGEDPYLASRFGVAMVEGFQGEDMTQADRVAACAKHFAAYGFTESGRDYNLADMSETKLRNVVLPPFEAVAKAGCATFMCSFNEINGVPASGNKWLFQDILRGEWDYDGMVISDYFSIRQMVDQGYVENVAESAKVSIETGIDMDMMSFAYRQYLDSLVSNNIVDIKYVDDAVRNVLKLKFRLGLFENPYTDLSRQATDFYAEDHLAAAKKAAVESAILFKNEGTLPIKDVKTIAVIGSLADEAFEQVGTWCFDAEPSHCVTPLTAIQAECEGKCKVIYEPAYSYSRDKNTSGIAKAVAAAKKADVVLLFVGEEAILSGEGRCRADINLPGIQKQLVAEVAKANKNTAMIVMAGRPLTIGDEVEAVSSVLYTFHGGTMAGPAISDLVFGKEVPSGKTPVTFPKMVGQIPIYYNVNQTGRPAYMPILIDSIPVHAHQTSLGFSSYWMEVGTEPLFPFGYGLTYTTFSYGTPRYSAKEMTADGSITVSVEVTNTGDYDAYEVVQMYIRDAVASSIRPMKELKGFEKVFIKKGETKTVEFTITADQLSFWKESEKMLEPGKFYVGIGNCSTKLDIDEIELK